MRVRATCRPQDHARGIWAGAEWLTVAASSGDGVDQTIGCSPQQRPHGGGAVQRRAASIQKGSMEKENSTPFRSDTPVARPHVLAGGESGSCDVRSQQPELDFSTASFSSSGRSRGFPFFFFNLGWVLQCFLQGTLKQDPAKEQLQEKRHTGRNMVTWQLTHGWGTLHHLLFAFVTSRFTPQVQLNGKKEKKFKSFFKKIQPEVWSFYCIRQLQVHHRSHPSPHIWGHGGFWEQRYIRNPHPFIHPLIQL